MYVCIIYVYAQQPKAVFRFSGKGFFYESDRTLFDVKFCNFSERKIKANIPVTGRGSPKGCEMSRLPHFLDNWPTDGGEVVSLRRRPAFAPRKIPGTHFC
jgi:hypothetical protein